MKTTIWTGILLLVILYGGLIYCGMQEHKKSVPTELNTPASHTESKTYASDKKYYAKKRGTDTYEEVEFLSKHSNGYGLSTCLVRFKDGTIHKLYLRDLYVTNEYK